MFGSVNLLGSLHASEFTPIDVVATLGINAGLTMYACDSDSFRISTPVIGEKIEAAVGDKYGWLGDARFILGLSAAALAHFGTKPKMDGTQMISDKMGRACHDITAGAWTSLVATEVCRAKAEEGMAASAEAGSPAMLGLDDDLIDDDLMGLEEYADAGSMNFAYGW